MSVKQPFDPEKFNFNKVQDKEVVFQAVADGSSVSSGSSLCIAFPTLHSSVIVGIASILHNTICSSKAFKSDP